MNWKKKFEIKSIYCSKQLSNRYISQWLQAMITREEARNLFHYLNYIIESQNKQNETNRFRNLFNQEEKDHL